MREGVFLAQGQEDARPAMDPGKGGGRVEPGGLGASGQHGQTGPGHVVLTCSAQTCFGEALLVPWLPRPAFKGEAGHDGDCLAGPGA